MPAFAGFTTQTILHFDIESNIKDMILWIKAIKSRQIVNEMKGLYESATNRDALQISARGIIQARIYDVWPDPHTRTYHLLESFVVGSEDYKNSASLALYSDPNIAPSKNDPSVSYAAFFESPEEGGVSPGGTFIRPAGVAVYRQNYRPFFQALQDSMDSQIGDMARDAILGAMLSLMPPSLEGTLT